MAKNRIFSGEKLSEKELSKIQEQLKKSRERDIKAMKESDTKRKKRQIRRRTNKIRQYVGGATTGAEAHDRYSAIMDNILKSERDEVRGMDYDDVFVAADAMVDDATGYWTAEDFENYIIDYLSGGID